MNEHLIRQLLGFAIDDSLAVGRASPEQIEKLSEQPLPDWLRGVLSFDWVTVSGDVWPCYFFYNLDDIFSHYLYRRAIAENIIPIGSGPNGDTLVIRFGKKRSEVGFLCHEEVDEAESLIDAYSKVTSSLEEFLLRIHDRLFLPADSYSGYGFSKLLDKTRVPSHPKDDGSK